MGKDYRKPSPGERFSRVSLQIDSEVRPAQGPTVQDAYAPDRTDVRSQLHATLDRYRKLLTGIHDRQIDLPNDNFDVWRKHRSREIPIER